MPLLHLRLMATQSVSRWWYGIAAGILFGILLYGFMFLFMLTGPSEPANSDGELIIKVLSLVAALVTGLILYLMTALYVISFTLDWWHISKSEITEADPTRLYLLIPVVALSNFIKPVIAAPFVTVGGVLYLWQRSKLVGSPNLSRLLS